MSEAGTPVRSTFVTVVAWTFIVLAGLASFISLLQALMFFFVFPDDMFTDVKAAKGLDDMPPFLRFMFAHMQWFFILFWSTCLVTLVSAIALLRRKNWARLVFVVLLALGIVWNLSGLWLQQQIMASFPKPPPTHDLRMADFQAGFEMMMTVMRFAMAAFAIAVSALFAWIIKRLLSQPVRAEFKASIQDLTP